MEMKRWLRRLPGEVLSAWSVVMCETCCDDVRCVSTPYSHLTVCQGGPRLIYYVVTWQGDEGRERGGNEGDRRKKKTKPKENVRITEAAAWWGHPVSPWQLTYPEWASPLPNHAPRNHNLVCLSLGIFIHNVWFPVIHSWLQRWPCNTVSYILSSIYSHCCTCKLVQPEWMFAYYNTTSCPLWHKHLLEPIIRANKVTDKISEIYDEARGER